MGSLYRSTVPLLPKTLGGRAVEYIALDDATDPSAAVRTARKLVTENKVDAIIGPSNVPTSLAVTEVAREARTPQLSLAPITVNPDRAAWIFVIAHGIDLMVESLTADMARRNVKTVAYIGFSDAWGDAVYRALQDAAAKRGIKVLSNERYARTDNSVTAQILKITSMNPDAVLVGGSGTPGALPHLSLRERGYGGVQYNTHGVINRDFLKLGGKGVDGVIVPSGPVRWSSCPPTAPSSRWPCATRSSTKRPTAPIRATPSRPIPTTRTCCWTPPWPRCPPTCNPAPRPSGRRCATPWKA